ncbi:MAG: DUF3885 domain-containing protein [Allosphingosinicella sp.]
MKLEPISGQWLAPFRASPYSLRFELGGETFGNEAPVPRFLQAFGRASQIVQEVFEGSRQLLGIVAAVPIPAGDLFAPARDGFEALVAAGFTLEPLSEWQAAMWPDQVEEEDREQCRWRSYDLGTEPLQRDVLLWCAISLEMAVTPKAPVSSFLADFDRNLLLHVYDDRGMDVIALDREPLLQTYRRRDAWLLDYDRERMREAFGEPA